MKVVLTAVPLLAAVVALSSYADNDVKLAAAQNEFLEKTNQETTPDANWRRHLALWQRINPEIRGNSAGIIAVTPEQPQVASGCSQ